MLESTAVKPTDGKQRLCLKSKVLYSRNITVFNWSVIY